MIVRAHPNHQTIALTCEYCGQMRFVFGEPECDCLLRRLAVAAGPAQINRKTSARRRGGRAGAAR